MADHQDTKAAAATTTADTTATTPQTTTKTSTSTPTPTPSTLSKLATKAKGYTKFWAEHVKKGEAPWTQWYCCGIVNGKECEKENHRLHKTCRACQHHVCENCVKGSI